MITYTDIVMFPSGSKGGCLTIGNFDGVHLGHQGLISATREQADQLNTTLSVLTFDPHPSQILRPQEPVLNLFPRKDMIHQMETLGIDHLIIHPFNQDMAQTTADEFIRNLIVKYLEPKVIFVGHDFSFGKGRAGDLETLRQLGRELGFGCRAIAPVEVRGETVSSSRIRQALKEGDVRLASLLLGRPFHISGKVVHGEGRGRKINFPTANVESELPLILKNGVYGVRLQVGGDSYYGLTNIGTRPTFHQSESRHVEVHIPDKNLNLYDQTVQVDFLFRIRDELKFSSARELMSQIDQDIKLAKVEFKNHVSMDGNRESQ